MCENCSWKLKSTLGPRRLLNELPYWLIKHMTTGQPGSSLATPAVPILFTTGISSVEDNFSREPLGWSGVGASGLGVICI